MLSIANFRVRSPSPDSLSETNLEMNMYDSNGQLREFNHLPLPLPREETEPTNPPVIEKGLCGFMVLDLEYVGSYIAFKRISLYYCIYFYFFSQCRT